MYPQITRYEMTQLSCKRDTKSKGHPGMKLAPMRVFLCKHPLSFYTLCLLPVCLPFMSAYLVSPLILYVLLAGMSSYPVISAYPLCLVPGMSAFPRACMLSYPIYLSAYTVWLLPGMSAYPLCFLRISRSSQGLGFHLHNSQPTRFRFL